jgi:hypothetical protein
LFTPGGQGSGEVADPIVLGERLPRQQDHATTGLQCAGNVGERSSRVPEEHRAGATDGTVEGTLVERVDLGVGPYELDVRNALLARAGAGPSIMRDDRSTVCTRLCGSMPTVNTASPSNDERGDAASGQS